MEDDLFSEAPQLDAEPAASDTTPEIEPSDEFEGLARGVIDKAFPGSDEDGEDTAEANAEGGAAPEGGGDATADPDADVPEAFRGRFQELRTEVDSLTKQLEATETDAKGFREIQGFLSSNHLTPDEAADGLEIMGLMKTDPQKAWAALKPIMQKVGLAAGELLSPEMQAAVRAGKYTQEHALQLSRAEALAKSAEMRLQMSERAVAQQSQTELARSMQTAAAGWETDARAKDPDYDKKQRFVLAEVSRRISAGDRPTTPEAVRHQLDDVLKAVNAELGSLRAPKKPRITPVTSGNAVSAAHAATKKQPSMLDLVNQVSG